MISKVGASFTPLITAQEAAKRVPAGNKTENERQLPTYDWPSSALLCLYGGGRPEKSPGSIALFSITPMLITCISNQCSHVNAPMWLFSLFSVQCQNCPKWVLQPAEQNLCLQMLKINGNGIQHLLIMLVVKWKIQLRSPWLFFPHNKSSRCNLISVMIVRLKTTKCIDKWTIPMWGRKKIRARGFFEARTF